MAPVVSERTESSNSIKSTDEFDECQSELFKLFFKEYAITAEYDLLIKQNLPGLYCVPKAENPYEWFGVLFLRQGPYQGAIFRFVLTIPSNFPDNPNDPTIKFEIPVFHPYIHPTTGTLSTVSMAEVSNKAEQHIYHTLIYAQQIFFKVDVHDAVNAEAANLFTSDPEKFQEKVMESVRRSREVVYDNPQSTDAHTIKFTPWDQTIHEPIRSQQILKRPASSQSPGSSSGSDLSPRNAQNCGLSFFDPRSLNCLASEKSRIAKE